MVGVCGTNTFAGRAVPQCPQTAGFTCGAAQETQEIKKEHKENNTTENTFLHILDAQLKKGWDEKLWNWDVYRVNAFGDLWVYEVLFHFVKH